MKFQFATLLLLTITFACNVFANSVTAASSLMPRHYKYPVKANDALIAKVMASVEAQVYTKVLAKVTANFAEELSASLDIKASLLGGAVQIGDLHIKAIQKAAVKKLKAEFDAELKAQVKAKVFKEIEVLLRKKCGHKSLTEKQLLKILIDVEAKLKQSLKVELPKIGVSLKLKAKEQIEVTLKNLKVDIPLIAKISVNASINEKAAIDSCISVGVKACAKLNATESAKLIIKGL